jgi:hypothetical protein
LCLDSQGVLYVGEVNEAASVGGVSPECHTLQRFNLSGATGHRDVSSSRHDADK